MKIKIAYQPEETEAAEAVAAAIRNKLPWARRKESVAHPPYRHIYITITASKLENACNTGKEVVK